MKKIVLLLIVVFGLLTKVQAQDDAISRYFNQYSDDEQFTSVYISNRMFSMFSKVVENDKEDVELKQAISKLKGLRILSSSKLVDGKKMYREASKTLPMKGYEELMVVKSEGNELKFLIIEANGKIKELLMLTGGTNNFFMLSMIGDIDLAQISKLSKTMNVEGIEHLNKLKDKKK